jgi:hypothetical protein
MNDNVYSPGGRLAVPVPAGAWQSSAVLTLLAGLPERLC